MIDIYSRHQHAAASVGYMLFTIAKCDVFRGLKLSKRIEPTIKQKMQATASSLAWRRAWLNSHVTRLAPCLRTGQRRIWLCPRFSVALNA